MQAQLDAGIHRDSPRPEAAAHKVLFPAYDPAQHGEDVRSVNARRKDAPVEGHFPAPRQPFQAAYKHADGRPMTPEENSVEQELQAQRCDETLSVLARDGVNGLLLSPRDLDAAVASGLLPAETAVTLWNTWAALRPVIHVIEDEPPESTLPSMSELLADTGLADAAEHRVSTQPPANSAAADEPAIHAAATDTPLQPVTEPAIPAVAMPLSTPRLRLMALIRTLLWLFVVFCVVTTTARLAMWAWLRWGHLWAGT